VNMSSNETLTFNGSSLTVNGAASGFDTFQFHSNFAANYTINNFVGSSMARDTIELDSSVLGGQSNNIWLHTNVVASGNNAIIHDGRNIITVVNGTVAQVQDDILFV